MEPGKVTVNCAQQTTTTESDKERMLVLIFHDTHKYVSIHTHFINYQFLKTKNFYSFKKEENSCCYFVFCMVKEAHTQTKSTIAFFPHSTGMVSVVTRPLTTRSCDRDLHELRGYSSAHLDLDFWCLGSRSGFFLFINRTKSQNI